MSVEHGLALLIFVGRAGDVLSTLFMTPTLLLEANPIVRRYKWPTIAIGFALCGVPYFDIPLAVMVAVTSLLVTASNLSRAWMARTLGEAEMAALLERTAARSSLRMALSTVWGSAFFFVLTAVLLIWLSPDNDIALYFGFGVALYGIVFAIHSSFFFVRIFRRASEEDGNAV